MYIKAHNQVRFAPSFLGAKWLHDPIIDSIAITCLHFEAYNS